MESRWVSCRGCGLQLAVSAEAQTIWCSRCRSTTPLPPAEPLGSRADDTLLSGLEWFKSLLTNRIASTSLNYKPPLPGGKKRALLCGVSYKSKRYELKGSINDVKCMRYFLVQKLGFPNESVLVLTEEESNPDQIPTKSNIEKALRWLIRDCEAGDSLVFHYSGHGSQKLNHKGEELDGYDETLCPLDYQTEGMILDDDINETIVRPLPKGATLHAIIDACHSGTVLDLPFVCKINRNGSYCWQDQRCHSGDNRGTNGGLALCFSSCDDHQISADTDAFTSGIMQGAMTYSFIRAADNAPGLTYGHLLTAMRSAIRDVNTSFRCSGPIASLIKRVFRCTKLSQEPQLSSSEPFDIYQKQFML